VRQVVNAGTASSKPDRPVNRSALMAAPSPRPFTKPSGKIEIYSLTVAAKPDRYGLGAMPPILTWFDPVEPDAKYLLMLCSPKSRARAHSIHGNQPLLARVDPDDVWMNPVDTSARGSRTGRRCGSSMIDAAAGEGDAPDCRWCGFAKIPKSA
jgi:anaerobic dimethyl sulfoxide reductase subunit A